MSDLAFKTRMMRSINLMSVEDLREDLYRAYARERQVRRDEVLLTMQIEDLQELLALANEYIPPDASLHIEISEYLPQKDKKEDGKSGKVV
ncbi:MAG: hypothetical protein V7754_15925 [Halioglobus sp.]